MLGVTCDGLASHPRWSDNTPKCFVPCYKFKVYCGVMGQLCLYTLSVLVPYSESIIFPDKLLPLKESTMLLESALLITFTMTLIILDITKSESNNCFIIH